MKEFLPVIRTAVLFRGIQDEEILAMTKCLQAHVRSYEKKDFLCRNGDCLLEMGLVLQGSIHLVKEDYWGRRTILARISQGQIFGEVFACLHQQPLSMSIVAAEPVKVLYLDVQRVVTSCTSACDFHVCLIRNFMQALAGHALFLNQKIEYISQRSTREKLLAYLSDQALREGSSRFQIPFNRQELADYLGIERSAMSNELSKMRRDGILDFQKNSFWLKQRNMKKEETT